MTIKTGTKTPKNNDKNTLTSGSETSMTSSAEPANHFTPS